MAFLYLGPWVHCTRADDRNSVQYVIVDHRQRGSDCTVLTATGLVNGEWQILTPYRIETPKPMDKKFGTHDYVGETTPYTKFGANRSTGGFWANR